MVDYQKLRNFDLEWKNYGYIPHFKIIVVFEQINSFRTLIYYGKLWYYGKNYNGTMEKKYGTVVN